MSEPLTDIGRALTHAQRETLHETERRLQVHPSQYMGRRRTTTALHLDPREQLESTRDAARLASAAFVCVSVMAAIATTNPMFLLGLQAAAVCGAYYLKCSHDIQKFDK